MWNDPNPHITLLSALWMLFSHESFCKPRGMALAGTGSTGSEYAPCFARCFACLFTSQGFFPSSHFSFFFFPSSFLAPQSWHMTMTAFSETSAQHVDTNWESTTATQPICLLCKYRVLVLSNTWRNTGQNSSQEDFDFDFLQAKTYVTERNPKDTVDVLPCQTVRLKCKKSPMKECPHYSLHYICSTSMLAGDVWSH